MQTRKYTSCTCRCGFSIAGFGRQPIRCPNDGRRLKKAVHEISISIHPGAKVNYSSVIGEAPDLKGCYIESDVFTLGGTPCVMISGKRGAVAVAALTEAI